ncbi:MAG: OsmC family protein [Elusimicrobia bacterium]|nr:OsmC family protein [Elusimicrobiota bacterium]
MYQAEVFCAKDMLFKVKANGFEINIDGRGGVISPLDILLAALGACAGVYIRKFAESTKLSLDNFIVRAEAELTDNAPYQFDQIKIDIDLQGVSLDESKRESLLRFVRNCPVHQTLKANPEMLISIK